MNDAPKKQLLWHEATTASVIEWLKSDRVKGLTFLEVAKRRAVFGIHEIVQGTQTPLWRRVLRPFQQGLVGLLFFAIIVSGLLREWAEAVAIGAIVLLNGFLSFFQEARAESTLNALQKLTPLRAKVIREGIPELIPARDLVPGDLVQLEAGDGVPADLKILESFGALAQESALTGESVPVGKDATEILPRSTVLPERKNILFSGTMLVSGKAVGMVVATGMQTELGKIASLLRQEERKPTPLEQRLAKMSRAVFWVCLAIVTTIFAIEYFRGQPWVEVLLFSVSLAVAAVPEGLAAVITVSLALGVNRMAKRNAIIRKLPSVETLGSVTIIGCDKTGTLTRNEMIATKVWAGKRTYHVTGKGYEPQGEFLFESQKTNPLEMTELRMTLTAGAWCNHARLVPPQVITNPNHTGKLTEPVAAWKIIGDPTEAALLVLAAKAGVANDNPSWLYEIPFDSQRKRMSVVVQDPDLNRLMYVKGACENVLTQCRYFQQGSQIGVLRPSDCEEILAIGAKWAGQALRVMALAYRHANGIEPHTIAEEELVFLGLVGIEDPPRIEVKTAVEKCRAAGIRTVVMTGDHPETALAVAKRLGISQGEEPVAQGKEIEILSDEKLADIAATTSVFARVSPEHKLRIIKALKQRREVVAMIGDGVNDAPAVKASDLGVCMGITGTDVTKNAADMVLVDDNFSTVVHAVEEGRAVFENIQRVVHYLLVCNTSEILLVFGASLFGYPTPLLAIQILWINLVTDGLPALALGMERPGPDVMNHPPRSVEISFFSPRQTFGLMLRGAVMAIVGGVAFFVSQNTKFGAQDSLERARAVTFCVMTGAQLFYAFAVRSHRYTIFQLGLGSNRALLGAVAISLLLQTSLLFVPGLSTLFLGRELDLTGDLGMIFGLSLIPLGLVELEKLIRASFPRGAFGIKPHGKIS